MERCYVCNHCGKCAELDLAIVPKPSLCLDCGHEVQPGESFAKCAACGSGRISSVSKSVESADIDAFS